ncbi:MAG: hypothetical protein LJE74_08785 [Proteobacteria bacterium]|nr:hypothetical protein [Pseudomonadota bacterium]
MTVWDLLITASKFCIICALWLLNGNLPSALLLYALLVALPLLLMRILSGYSIASLQSLLLTFIGLDLLQLDHRRPGSSL